jgi:hypothetical protein
LVVPSAVAAAASPAPSLSAARSVAVSVPADPVSLTPAETTSVSIRVLNPGTSSVTVTVKGEGITLGDNGTTTFTERPDPVWGSRTRYPAGDITIPAQQYVDLSIGVQMPAHISPDLYYIGFVVTPVPTAGGDVVVINQIGAFLTINVPGPRVRALAAQLTTTGFNWWFIHINGLVIGDHVDGKLTVRNVGASSVLFYGENDVTSAPITGSPTQERISRSLLPTGRSRSFAVSAAASFPIDVVTMNDIVTYPDRNGIGTLQIVRAASILVISPWVVLVLLTILVLVGGWRLGLRLRRRSARRAMERPPLRIPRSWAAMRRGGIIGQQIGGATTLAQSTD